MAVHESFTGTPMGRLMHGHESPRVAVVAIEAVLLGCAEIGYGGA